MRYKQLKIEKCKKKVDHDTALDAWRDAQYQTIKHGLVTTAYKCVLGCNKYHLSTHNNLGDGSHIPLEMRAFYIQYTEPEKTTTPSFIAKLRKVLV